MSSFKMRLLLVAALASGTCLISRGIACASNAYCVSGFPNSSYILVGEGFTIPGPNKCKAFIGFNAEGGSSVSGTGCTTLDGFLVLATTNGSIKNSFVEFDNISLSLPSQTGDWEDEGLQNGSSFHGTASGISGGKCFVTSTDVIITSPSKTIDVKIKSFAQVKAEGGGNRGDSGN